MLSSSLDLQLPASTAAAASARRAVERCVFVSPARRDDVKLVVTEMVSNAVRHSLLMDRAVITVRLARSAQHILVEVVDPGPCFDMPPASPTPGESEGGMGLFIVSQTAHRWGVEARPEACRVWAELRA